MPNTMKLIASSTVGSGGAATIEFTSIPSTYTDLVVKLSLRGASGLATMQLYMTFNNSTSSFTSRQMYGDGTNSTSATLSNSGAAISMINMNTTEATANTFSSTDVYILNYAGSNNKAILADSVTENNAVGALAGLNNGLWSNSSAITSIKFTNQAAVNFVQHSTAQLYGIVKQ